MARGAAGVHLKEGVVRIEAHHRVGGALPLEPGLVVRETLGVTVGHDQVAQARGLGQDRSHQPGEAFADERHLGAGVLEDVGDLGRRQTPVHRDSDRADFGGAEQDFEETIRILVEYSDAGTRTMPSAARPLARREQRLSNPR